MNDKPPVIDHLPVNLCGEKTIWQGPHMATYIRYPSLGVSILAGLAPVKR